MPIYEYHCKGCKVTEETFRKIDERHLAPKCILCESPMERKVSLPVAHLWKPMELELETNKPKVYDSKRKLKSDCDRLGKAMPGLDIY